MEANHSYSGNNLEPHANLSGANLNNADLTTADLQQCHAVSARTCDWARSCPNAILTGATLTGGNLQYALTCTRAESVLREPDQREPERSGPEQRDPDRARTWRAAVLYQCEPGSVADLDLSRT